MVASVVANAFLIPSWTRAGGSPLGAMNRKEDKGDGRRVLLAASKTVLDEVDEEETLSPRTETPDFLSRFGIVPKDGRPFFPPDFPANLFPWLRKKSAPPPSKHPLRPSLRSALDVYAQVYLSSAVRVRVKHTLAVLDQLKVKSEATMHIGRAPVVALEVKLLEVLKYRVASGGNCFQVRTVTPLKLPRAFVDIVYEHRAGHGDAVRVAFRFERFAFLKVPGVCAGGRLENRIGDRVKTSLKLHREFGPQEEVGYVERRNARRRRREEEEVMRQSGPRGKMERLKKEIRSTLKVSEMSLRIKIRCMQDRRDVERIGM